MTETYERTILGFSNIYRFYNGSKCGNINYKVVKTTYLDKLNENISTVTDKVIIIGMIENAIADEISRAENDEEVEDLGKDAINKVMEIATTYKSDKPDAKIMILLPLRRPGVRGFNECLNTWSNYMEGCIKGLKKEGIISIRPLTTRDGDYDKDGIHLTKNAGN